MADSQALVSEGVKLLRGDGATPTEVFNAVGEVISFDGPGGSASVMDITHLNSLAREKRMGLPDEGQISFGLNLIPSDAEQVGLRTDRDNRVKRNFKLELTDAGPTTIEFTGFVLEFPIAGAVDEPIRLNVTIEITGQNTWS